MDPVVKPPSLAFVPRLVPPGFVACSVTPARSRTAREDDSEATPELPVAPAMAESIIAEPSTPIAPRSVSQPVRIKSGPHRTKAAVASEAKAPAPSSQYKPPARVVTEGKFGDRYGKWEVVELAQAEPVEPERIIQGISVQMQLDDTYRNGPKGASFNLTEANLVFGKRERKARVLELPPTSPPRAKKASAPKPRKREHSGDDDSNQDADGQGAAANDETASKMPKSTLLMMGTASRGPLGEKRKTLSELYPWVAPPDEWLMRATERLERPVDAAFKAAHAAVPEYAGAFPMRLEGPTLERLRSMWAVCNSIPGEGGNSEPLYGEINLAGVCSMYAVWKELCGFSVESTFLDVGSGLAKMVFHAALDPGVRMAHGIELSEYRARTSQSILTHLLPKAGIADIAARVSLCHQDVKAMASFEGITHIYMFDLGFPADPYKGPYPHILKLWCEAQSAQYLISYRKPHFLYQRGFDLQLVTKLRVKQQGKGGSHLAYFYRKTPARVPE